MAALAAQSARGMSLTEERLQGATEVGDALRAQLEAERAELRASHDEVSRLVHVVESLRTELKAAQEALSTALAASPEPSPPDSIQLAMERLQLAARAFLAHASQAAAMGKAEAAARAVLGAFGEGDDSEAAEASSRASAELARRLLGFEIQLLVREGAVACAELEAAAEQLRLAYAGREDAGAQAA